MDDRAKIPGLALLSLSFTTCVERNPVTPEDGDDIVGQWHAVAIDDDKFPIVYAEGGARYEIGVELFVDAALSGSLTIVQDSEYEGYIDHRENGSVLTVDAGDAPKYRIEVRRDLFGGEEPEPTTVTITGYETGYYGTTGYDSVAPTSGYDPTTGGVVGGPGSALPLQIPLAPSLAPAAMILNCTLAGDKLTCDRGDDDEPKHWVFERDDPDAG